MTKRTVSKTLAARVADVVASGETAAAEYLDDLLSAEGGIETRVRMVLSQRLEDRVVALIGMRRTPFGGGWEIDRSARTSPILTALDERVKATAQAWVDAALAKPVKPTKADIDNLREEYIDGVVRRAGGVLEDCAHDYAEALASDLLDSLRGDA